MSGSHFGAFTVVSDLDITHRWAASYIWELPRLTGQTAALRHVLGGWETSGIVTLESGRWINFVSGRDNSGTVVNGDRADLVTNPFLSTLRSRGVLREWCSWR
jgi:hypothetical protein